MFLAQKVALLAVAALYRILLARDRKRRANPDLLIGCAGLLQDNAKRASECYR